MYKLIIATGGIGSFLDISPTYNVIIYSFSRSACTVVAGTICSVLIIS